MTIPIHPTDVPRTMKIGALLQDEWKVQFEKFLKDNVDVFTWSHDEIPGIEPEMIVHRLNVDPDYKPV